jgi:preprotein translocase subunit SecB
MSKKGWFMTNETENTPDGGTAPEDTSGGDPGTGTASQEAQAAPQPLSVHAQYIKDLSFEAPSTPQIFKQMQDQQPNISVHVDVRATTLDAPVYEVVINVKVECKIGETMGFILELAYGGIFSVNVNPEHVRPVLLIECPRMLFPFARQVIASTTTNGGFLPLMLAPVDFAALYRKQLQEQKTEAATATALPEENEKLV